jgi:hypothetical protein
MRQDFKKTTQKIVEAAAIAGDEMLVQVGKDAEARQAERTRTTNGKLGKTAMTIAAAAGAFTAGAVAARAMGRRRGAAARREGPRAASKR